jgi:transcriptional regulator with XRE-family HTH domain
MMKPLTADQLEKLRAIPVTPDRPNRIAAAREIVGATQEMFEKATGIKQSGVSHLERGNRKNITLDKARGIADAFGAHVDDLFPRTPPPPKPPKRKKS